MTAAVVSDVAVARVLRDAADYIDEHGWCQGEFELADGRVCVLGALNHRRGWIRGRNMLRAALGVDHLADWNDAPGRTQAEVTGLLRRVADELDPAPEAAT